MYSNNFQNLKEVIRNLRNVENFSTDQLLNNYVTTYKVRHNVIHCLLCSSFVSPQVSFSEKTARELGYVVLEEGMEKTPDIMFDKKGILVISDVTVQYTKTAAYNEKLEKYKAFAQNLIRLNDNLTDFVIIPFVVKPDFSDLETSFYEFRINVSSKIESNFTEFDYISARVALKEITDIQAQIRSKINDEDMVSKMLAYEFGKRSPETPIEMLHKSTNKENILGKHSNVYVNGRTTCEQPVQSEDDIVKIFADLIVDKDIRETLAEVRTTPLLIESAYKNIIQENDKLPKLKEPKPSIHTIYIPDMSPLFTNAMKFKQKEQNQILSLMEGICSLNNNFSGALEFVADFANIFVDMMTTSPFAKFNRGIFDFNQIIDPNVTANLKMKYEEYRKQSIKTKSIIQSFHTFCKNHGVHESGRQLQIPDDHAIKAVKQKIVKIPVEKMTPAIKAFWEKSHSGSKKRNDALKQDRTETLDPKICEDFDRFAEILNIPKNDATNLQFDDFMSSDPGDDMKSIYELKSQMVEQYDKVLATFRHYPIYQYMWGQMLTCEQLMHFFQLTLSSNTFSMFTTGNPNICTIVNNCYHDSGKDVGKAFMTFGLVRDRSYITSLYGKVDIKEVQISGKQCYFFASNWRRLTTTKVTFLKDQFFSVINTAMAYCLRRSDTFDNTFNIDVHDTIYHSFTVKALLSLCSNQRVAELLSDVRYLIMACISDYSRIDKFIEDKFCGPYRSVVETWIMKRLDNILTLSSTFKSDPGMVRFKQPKFHGLQRQEDSIGGKLNIPSIWTKHRNTDLQDFLDDMFLYVHTIKEPSNIHHENIKALNTIMKYQTEYDSLPISRKTGSLNKFDDYKDFMLDRNIIGFSHSVIQHSTSDLLDTVKHVDWLEKWESQKMESISEVTSTKAVIPEYDRILVEKRRDNNKSETNGRTSLHESDTVYRIPGKTQVKKEKVKAKHDEYVRFLSKHFKTDKFTIKEPLKVKLNKSNDTFLQGSTRAKVHDAIIDFMSRYPHIKTVYEAACWNLNENIGRVEADICIKAQYGAKREFYVVNLGAKMMARTYEQMFHKICRELPNEMISVSGDKKILIMQEKINNILSKKKSDQELYFVNGDCTKWSAAETMECFTSLVHGMKKHMPSEFCTYSKDVIACWAKKSINVPQSLLDKTMLITDKTKYLENKQIKINSTQNFLQGMWNYSSSFKAVASTTYTYKIWKKIYPNSKLYMDHLEHSDDYILMILTDSVEELEDFRILHRMIMKCHGFNDSVKKTNTQKFLMEFISLCSFNGHMTYPHIKKTKEVGMNTGCTGYRDDVDTASSRVGEAVRVGLPFCSAYFMQRAHYYNVYRSYSLNLHAVNNLYTHTEALNNPVELFGLPDTHPLFQLLCQGDVNNYRLYTYVKGDASKSIERLFAAEYFDNVNNPYKLEVSPEDPLRLYHPTYVFDQENKLIKKIRASIDIPFDDAQEFWNTHKAYNLIKPRTRDDLLMWMKSMYYRSNFALAYSRSSRAEITLRLSTFVKSACLIIDSLKLDDGNPRLLTIKDFTSSIKDNKLKLISQSNVDKLKSEVGITKFKTLLNKTLVNCDSTVTSIYSFFEGSHVIFKGVHEKNTIANLSPSKLNWLHVDNPIDSLFEYVFDYQSFLKDNRPFKSMATLESDKAKLQLHYNIKLNEATPMPIVKSCYQDLILSKSRRNLYMSYSTKSQTLEDFIKTQVDFGTFPGMRIKIISPGVTEAINPHTGEFVYKKIFTHTKDEIRILLDDAILLYGILKHGYKIESTTLKTILPTLKINDSIKSTMIRHYNTEHDLGYYIKKCSIKELYSMGCRNYEMKNLAYLKAYLYDDPQGILDLMSENLTYTYSYAKLTSQEVKIMNATEKVEFTYINEKFVAYNSAHGVILFTEDQFVNKSINAFKIAEKLFNKISQFRLENEISDTSLKELPLIGIETMQSILENYEHSSVYNKLSHRFVDNLELSMSTKVELIPIIRVRHIRHTVKKLQGQPMVKDFRPDFENSTIYIGRQKLFTVPFLAVSQSNITVVGADTSVGGLKASWWLTHDRIYNFIHGDKISTEKSIFNSLDLTENTTRNFDLEGLEDAVTRLWEPLPELGVETQNQVRRGAARYDQGTMDELKMFLNKEKLRTSNTTSEDIPEPTPEKNYIEEGINIDFEDLELCNDPGSDDSVDPLENYNLHKKEVKSSINIDLDEFELGSELSDDEELLNKEETGYVVEQSTDSSGRPLDTEIDPGDDLIAIGELASLEPKFETVDRIYNNTTPFSINAILDKGHPTVYLIKTSYVEDYQLKSRSVTERLLCLIRLKTLYRDKSDLSSYEQLLVLTLADKILMDFPRLNYLDWKDNWVLKFLEGKFEMCYLMIGCKSRAVIDDALSKGAYEQEINEKHHLFVKLPMKLKKKYTENIPLDVTTDNFLNMSPIVEAYIRLYRRKYCNMKELQDLLSEL